jgi:hypothetical protein
MILSRTSYDFWEYIAKMIPGDMTCKLCQLNNNQIE